MAEDVEPEKRVSWAELFFDLVFVFAITELTALLHADHSLAGLGRALILFVPIYWAWVGTSVHANTRDVENALDRIGIFAVGLGSLFMALAVPEAFGERAVLFASAYLGLRIVLLALVLRIRRFFLNPFTVAVLVSGPLRLVGAFLPEPWLVSLWAAAAVIDLATPTVARRWVVRQVRIARSHLPERFAQFLIIALGESVVAIGAPAAVSAHLGLGTGVAVAVAFALVCGLWWIYFMFSRAAVEHALDAGNRTDTVRQVLSYGHFLLIGAIVAVAVGLTDVVAGPDHHLPLGVAALLFGGAALYLGTLGLVQRRTDGHWSVRRFVAAAVALVLLVPAIFLPALAALSLLGVVVVAVALVEHRLDQRAAGRSTAHAGAT